MRSTNKLNFRVIAVVLVLLTVVLSACGAGSSTNDTGKAPANKQILNETFPGGGIADIETFDPAKDGTTTSNLPISMVFTGLVALDNSQKVVPELASRWDISSDGLTYTFTLRSGLKFSDGTSLTSADVAYSIDRALDPSLGSTVASSYLNLIVGANERLAGKIKTIIGDGVLTPNANTVVIKITKPVSYFLATLTYPTAYVVEKKLITEYGNTNFTNHLNQGGGSGPFKVKSYTHGKSIVLVPNPYYYKAKPIITVNLIFYKDLNTAYEAYLNGQLDRADVPTADLAQVKSTSAYHETPTLSTYYYALNFDAKPFNNIKIRQAFDLALNKTEMSSIVYKGALIPTNHIIPAGMPGYDPNLKGPDGTTSTSGNPTLAKTLFTEGLKEDGYANVAALPKLQFPYNSGNSDLEKEITIAVQEWHDVLGVNIQVVPTDFETLTAEEPKTVGNGSMPLFSTGWIDDYPDPQDFTTLQFAPGSSNNSTNYGQNKSSDAAAQVKVQNELAAADVEKDTTTRLSMYNDAEQKLVNDVAWLPTFQQSTSRVLKTYVKGYSFNASDLIPPFDWANVYIENH
jgi:oligopeptide transport system substrate-binding protein